MIVTMTWWITDTIKYTQNEQHSESCNDALDVYLPSPAIVAFSSTPIFPVLAIRIPEIALREVPENISFLSVQNGKKMEFIDRNF